MATTVTALKDATIINIHLFNVFGEGRGGGVVSGLCTAIIPKLIHRLAHLYSVLALKSFNKNI